MSEPKVQKIPWFINNISEVGNCCTYFVNITVNLRVSVLPVVTTAHLVAAVMASVTENLTDSNPVNLTEAFCLLTNRVPFKITVVLSVVTAKLSKTNALEISFL